MAADNTIESFQLALRLGARALESDVWITADGVAVLDHDGVVRSGLRRRAIIEMVRDELPSHIPTLAELYTLIGSDIDLSLDVKDPRASAEVVACARDAGAEARLWLCHPDRELVVSWRDLSPAVNLVESIRLRDVPGTFETHVAASAEIGIQVINLHHTEWSGGQIALVHRFGMLAFGWDAQHERILAELLDAGIDGVFCDHVDRMVSAIDGL